MLNKSNIYRFDSSMEEGRFLHDFTKRTVKQTRVAIIVGIVILLSFTRFDFLTQADLWYRTFLLRVGVGIFPLTVLLFLTYQRNFYRYAQLALVILSTLTLLSITLIAILIVKGPDSQLHFMAVLLNMTMACIFAATAFGMLAKAVFYAIATTVLITWLALSLSFDMNAQFQEGNVSIMFGTIIVSVVIAMQIEIRARQSFRAQRKQLSDNIKLKSLSLQLTQAKDGLELNNEFLEQAVKYKTTELRNTRDVAILSMALLAETRDNETGNHIRRTQGYVEVLARQLQKSTEFKDVITDNFIEIIRKSAPLHDIGKVGIPDHILLKPGKLTTDEFEIMKKHVALGANAIEQAQQSLVEIRKTKKTFLSYAIEIAAYHHEKWDGSGYMEGLSGRQIPLSARIMAIADVYDALISRRVYKEPISHDDAVNIIESSSGTHFDPVLVDNFLKINHLFRDVSERYQDVC